MLSAFFPETFYKVTQKQDKQQGETTFFRPIIKQKNNFILLMSSFFLSRTHLSHVYSETSNHLLEIRVSGVRPNHFSNVNLQMEADDLHEIARTLKV